ncbi:Protein-export membrane protein SecG [Burkholderiales bacterium]|nr:Protein-export membrane protein SecG [Burkholderiales bacterium]
MNAMEFFLLMLHIGVAVAICGLVLLQHGKGADMGAAFGSGSAGSVFGSAGSSNFLSHSTAILASVFFLTSVGLTWYASANRSPSAVMDKSVLDRVPPPATKAPDVPAAPAGTTEGAAPGSKAGDVPK